MISKVIKGQFSTKISFTGLDKWGFRNKNTHYNMR